LFFVTFQSKSFSAQIILGGAPLLIGALWVLPKRLGIATTLLTCIIITTCMPFIALGVYRYTDWLGSGLGNSVLSRVEIWNQAASRASEKPWLGWGLDSARVMPDRDERSILPDYKGLQKVTHLHPHNAPLQIWFELGGVGIAAVCALFLFFYTRLVQMTNHIAARYGTFMWTTTFLYTLSIWGIWQSWFIATICLIGVVSAWSVADQDI
jgi:O-antigen ligase